jgi:hypothetical protein
VGIAGRVSGMGPKVEKILKMTTIIENGGLVHDLTALFTTK